MGPGTDRALSPALMRLRQENHCEFQDSLGRTEIFCLRHKIKYLKSMVARGSEARGPRAQGEDPTMQHGKTHCYKYNEVCPL